MTVTTYQGWLADGKPFRNCVPLLNFIATLRLHGYTGPGSGLGDLSHLTASLPEDHCPYSHTPWPGAQPYPYILAIDIMPGQGLDIIELGGRLFDDKSSNVAGTQPIKYLNWTDSDGNVWHDSWMPNHTRFRSTDSGHIHMSFRTDLVTSTVMASYDPYGGTDVTPEQATQLNAVFQGMYQGGGSWGDWVPASDVIAGSNNGLNSQVQHLHRTVDDLEKKVDLILEKLASGGGPAPTPGNFTINLSGQATPE